MASAWERLLSAFASEAGDAPSSELEGWERLLLAKLAARQLGVPKAPLERRWLQATTLDDCHQLFQEADAPLAEARALLARSRSRSPRKLRRCRELLRGSPNCGTEKARLARQLLRRPLEVEGDALPPCLALAAPASLGPPAFFPVGNAAGRFAPLTSGLEVAEPRLLFIGMSDPRHLLSALALLDETQRVTCVLNDLNAETCARNALILELLSGSEMLGERMLAIFSIWWLHELPSPLLPLMCRAAAQAKAQGCCRTKATLESWCAMWSQTSSGAGSELQEVLQAAQLEGNVKEAASNLVEEGMPVVVNSTLRHAAARLEYNLHSGHVSAGWEEAGDGVLLWPGLDEADEFDADRGQPNRDEYLAACAKLLPLFVAALSKVGTWFQQGRAHWRCQAGDCLALLDDLPGSAGFHRIFTSNVADHVGVPSLALKLLPFLETHGRLVACLSNNLKAVDFGGDTESLFPKLHGVTLEAAAKALGAKHQSCGDQVWLQPKEAAAEDSKALLDLIVFSADRLYRCPQPADETIRRRMEHGDCLGMAHRFARRFSCSAVTVACLARLLLRLAKIAPEVAAEACARVVEAAPHSLLRLAQCLPKELPAGLQALPPEARPRSLRLLRFRVSQSRLPRWAWRTHPTVVLLWV
ncbi:unnamed protein product, partial [Effrenium voratum]